MQPQGRRTKFSRRLGFRLTAGYLLFFALLLAVVGLLFLSTLNRVQDAQTRELLEGDRTALAGFLRETQEGLAWQFDENDPLDSFSVERLQHVFILADQDGNLLQASPAYRAIGLEPPEEIQRVLRSREPVWANRKDPWGTNYLVRMCKFSTSDGKLYFIAQGRNVALNDATVRRFAWQYFSALPLIVLVGGLLGWFMTKRGLRPLDEVVHAADSISGSNLSLRIPARGAGDELDRLIDTFNRMIGRLENSFEQMRQFTTDVSHELRTPITAVRGQLEVALMTASSEQQLRDAIQTALEEAERLSDFVRAMLQLSQAESGQLALKREPHDLCLAARDVLDQYRPAAEEASLSLITDFTGQCIAEVDRIQFDRLLSNLIANAIKYTPPGGEVRCRLRRSPHGVELSVEDTGRGIPKESLPRIFERFYRVPSSSTTEARGIGLGLSFVAWIAKAHGGTIDVSSEVGRGTRFLVKLPAVAFPAPALAATRAGGVKE